MTILTTNEDLLKVAEENKHLLKEEEIVIVKGFYGTRKYKKVDNELRLILG